jgi:hypothetical protein
VANEKKPVAGGDETRELSRRKLLERVALGGAAISVTLLPSEWVKPVVETIVVPAHAQVSGPSPSAPVPSPSPSVSFSATPSPTPSQID